MKKTAILISTFLFIPTILWAQEFDWVTDTCQRSRAVRKAINEEMSVEDCGYVLESDLDEITSLYIHSSSITLEPNDFEGLTNLETLSLNGNEIRELPENVFERLTKLQRLSLRGNKIQKLPENVFEGLTNLETLSLSDNWIQELPKNVFEGLTSLRYLHLSDNMIQKLPENVFEGLTNLETLSLSDNWIQELPENVFEGLTKLDTLYLYGNPWEIERPTLRTHFSGKGLLKHLKVTIERKQKTKKQTSRKNQRRQTEDSKKTKSVILCNFC